MVYIITAPPETISLQDLLANPAAYRPREQYHQLDGDTLHWCQGMADLGNYLDGHLEGCTHECGGDGATGYCAYVTEEPHDCAGPTCPHYNGTCGCPVPDDEDCADCGERAKRRECDDCGMAAYITDCGHFPQPRPISAADGRDYCNLCYAGRQKLVMA